MNDLYVYHYVVTVMSQMGNIVMTKTHRMVMGVLLTVKFNNTLNAILLLMEHQYAL
jgi:hypothetical protein